MTHKNDLRTLLTRCLNPYGGGSAEETSIDLERVWRRMQPDVLRVCAPAFKPPRHQRTGTLLPKAIAAMLVLGVAIGAAMIWPRDGVKVYAAGADGLEVTLADDSRVEMRAHAEMTVDRASDGMQIDLKTGDIIVTAARQRDGNLSVRTKDFTVAVDGTVFLAVAGEQGSRVGVIEGEVRVREGREGSVEARLRPGEQVATSLTIERPLVEDIMWSRNRDAHLRVLASFQKGITNTAGLLERLNQTPPTAQGAAARTSSQKFEEASVRPCDPDNLPAKVPGTRAGGGANSFYMTPGRTSALCMTVATLIRTAYGYAPVEFELDGLTDPKAPARFRRPPGWNSVAGLGVEDGRRVRGGPDWVRTERYTIEAVADGPASAATMSGPMLLALLEQRFKLKAHVETEQVPAFALVVAPGGLKIKPAQLDSCLPDPRSDGIITGGMRPLADVRRGEKRLCGRVVYRDGPNQVYVAGGSTFSALAEMLGTPFGRRSDAWRQGGRVYDRTGITDTFNWILEFAPDENEPGAAVAEPSNVPRAPTIFVALEQQLGLHLEPAQAPREFVVIDSIERPGPN
jgi:uncharacterized protein (TIGR03435 family)